MKGGISTCCIVIFYLRIVFCVEYDLRLHMNKCKVQDIYLVWCIVFMLSVLCSLYTFISNYEVICLLYFFFFPFFTYKLVSMFGVSWLDSISIQIREAKLYISVSQSNTSFPLLNFIFLCIHMLSLHQDVSHSLLKFMCCLFVFEFVYAF